MKLEITKGQLNSLRHLILSNLKYDKNHSKLQIDDEDILKIIQKSLNVVSVKSIQVKGEK
jgi:hypothetical protein